jgi:hypothetical protein
MACVAGRTELASAHGERRPPSDGLPSKLCATLDFSRRLRVDRNRASFSSPKYRFLGCPRSVLLARALASPWVRKTFRRGIMSMQ